MSYQDQPEQNGASFHPPPPRNYHRTRNRGGDGFGCCLLDCLCCFPKCLCECGCCLLGCVFEIIFSILITVVVIVGLIVLIIWLIVQPHGLKFKVTDAALTTFNFNTDNLNFNMAVNFTVRNPNRRMGVYYDDIQANLNYGWHRLKTIEAMTFYQGHKNTSSLGTLVFKGQNVVILGSDEKLKFDQQSKDGLYEIQVKFHLRVTFKVGIIKSGNWKPKVKCNLKVPLLGNSSQIFQETKCNYYF